MRNTQFPLGVLTIIFIEKRKLTSFVVSILPSENWIGNKTKNVKMFIFTQQLPSHVVVWLAKRKTISN